MFDIDIRNCFGISNYYYTQINQFSGFMESHDNNCIATKIVDQIARFMSPIVA